MRAAQLSATRDVLFVDLDGTIVNIFQQLQVYLWHLIGIWFPERACTEYRVDGPLYEWLIASVSRDRPREGQPCVPSDHPCRRFLREVHSQEDLNRFLVESFWSRPTPYARAAPYGDLWQAVASWPGLLHFVTSRPKGLTSVTQQWLNEWGLSGRPVSHTEDKVETIDVLIRGHYSGYKGVFIDDCAHTVRSMQFALSGTIFSYLVDAPWNRAVRLLHVAAVTRRRAQLAALINNARNDNGDCE